MDSLLRQTAGEQFSVVVVDRFSCERGMNADWFGASVRQYKPKPCVWSGQFRLCKEDWFSAASYRNTGLCLTRTSHIAYVDDLSVLQPGWLNAALEAAQLSDTITCGAYKKVKSLVVKDGVAVNYEETDAGTDNRLRIMREEHGPCTGEWLYGCSLVAPVEALLAVDGWPESICDGMGFEDCLLGIVLQNAGYKFRYDKLMLTLESDELHSAEPAMRREDFGLSPDDKSHRALNIARASKTFDNGFAEGGIRELRAKVLRGEPFPIQQNPQHEWFTGTALKDL